MNSFSICSFFLWGIQIRSLPPCKTANALFEDGFQAWLSSVKIEHPFTWVGIDHCHKLNHKHRLKLSYNENDALKGTSYHRPNCWFCNLTPSHLQKLPWLIDQLEIRPNRQGLCQQLPEETLCLTAPRNQLKTRRLLSNIQLSRVPAVVVS